MKYRSATEGTLATARGNQGIRYEPEERCPTLLSVGIGFQGMLLMLGPAVVLPTIIVRAADQPESYLTWAVFAALVVAGVTTVLQAVRAGRLGTGHVLASGASGIFIPVCVTALVDGGPAMLASLVVISSIVQIALAAWLPLLRRIITPAVSGTAMMLILYGLVQIVFDKLNEIPEDASAAAAPSIAAVTLAVAAGMSLRSTGAWRLWSPLIGIVAGCVAAAAFGVYDFQRVIDASWIDVPRTGWPGFDFTPGPEFWAILPTFLIVTLLLTIKIIGDGIAIQAPARRRPRTPDFRIVQGALNANGVGNLLAGIAGTVPTTGYSASSASLVSLTGVASRRIGYAIGAMFVGLAFLPKLTAFLIVIPGPVVGVYVILLMGVLFVAAMRMIVQGGLDLRNTIIVGLAFWIGIGAENRLIFPDQLSGAWEAVLGNGTMVGTIVAIVLTLFVQFTSARRKRLEAELDFSALPEIDAFIRELAARTGWNDASTQRLRSAGEETLSSLLQPDDVAGDSGAAVQAPRLIVTARPVEGAMEMEFIAASEQENLEDRLAYLGEQTEIVDEREISFRLLRHYASSVRHQKYQGVDIITVQVEGS